MKRPDAPPGERKYRLFVTSVSNGRVYSDEKRFYTPNAAFKWLRTMPQLELESASLYDGEELIAEVSRGEL